MTSFTGRLYGMRSVRGAVRRGSWWRGSKASEVKIRVTEEVVTSSTVLTQRKYGFYMELEGMRRLAVVELVE